MPSFVFAVSFKPFVNVLSAYFYVSHNLVARVPFFESPGNFSGPESYFMCAMFTLKTQILLVLKAEQ